MQTTASSNPLIETGQRLSRSLLWNLQRGYYEHAGVDAWNRAAVPHYITNNPVIAAGYARLALAYLRDCRASGQLDPSRPVYLLELGAGTGRLAFYFLRRFLDLLEHSDLCGQPVTYILSDLPERNLAFWQTHPRLAPFVAAGQLDFARFDAIHDQTVLLRVSGQTLAPGAPRNPLIAIANYVFDSIPQDAFYINDGLLCEALVTLTTGSAGESGTDVSPVLFSAAGINPANGIGIITDDGITTADSITTAPNIVTADRITPAGITTTDGIHPTAPLSGYAQSIPSLDPRSLNLRYQPRFIPPDYFSDPDFNAVLNAYPRLLRQGYLAFPTGGLEMLRALRQLSGDRLLLLAADRGYYQPEALQDQPEPRLYLHGSGFSMQVNFHALAGYIQRAGGSAFLSQNRVEGLVLSAFTLGLPQPETGTPVSGETAQAFAEAIQHGGPDDFFTFKKAVEPLLKHFSLEQLLALLRLSQYDPNVFEKCAPSLLEQVVDAGPLEQQLAAEVAAHVWDAYYPIGELFDLPLALGKLFAALTRYPEAQECLNQSLELYGPSEEALALLKICRRYVW